MRVFLRAFILWALAQTALAWRVEDKKVNTSQFQNLKVVQGSKLNATQQAEASAAAVSTQQAEMTKKSDPKMVPLGYIPAHLFWPTCKKICDQLGQNTEDPDVGRAACAKETAKYAAASGDDVQAHCKVFGEQMALTTTSDLASGEWKLNEANFCGRLLEWSSYNSKKDMMLYWTPDERKGWCTDMVGRAIGTPGAPGAKEKAAKNIPFACKATLEEEFQKRGLQIMVPGEACKHLRAQAEGALASNELDPNDGGQQFCKGFSIQGKVFQTSLHSPAPLGFPKTDDWAPTVTLDNFAKMVHQAFGTWQAAWKTYDQDGDGFLNQVEWEKVCGQLKIPTRDCKNLKRLIDIDPTDGKISMDEFQDAVGVTLDGLRKLLLKKHGNAKKGWKAGDKNGDEKMTMDEFIEHCKEVGVTKRNAKNLFDEVDVDKNGDISEEEYYNVFGVTLDEAKRRVSKIFGGPQEGFARLDKDGNGCISEEEWSEGCIRMDIPDGTCKRLFDKMDKSKDGCIQPEEWADAMGMSVDDLRRLIYKKGTTPQDVWKKLGDGTKDDFIKVLKDLGVSDEDIESLFGDIDTNGDGQISKAEWDKAMKIKEMKKARFTTPADMVDLPELRDRLLKKHGDAEKGWKAADVNGDGELSPEEWERHCSEVGVTPENAKKLLPEVDTDNSGTISEEEYKNAFSIAADIVEGIDDSGDGKITEKEFKKAMKEAGVDEKEAEKLYKQIDKDGDGTITKEDIIKAKKSPEMKKALKKVKKKIDQEEVPPPPRVAPEKKVTIPMMRDKMRDAYKTTKDAWDAISGDGDPLTADEWEQKAEDLGIPPGQAEDLLKKMDKDGDGKISEEEFQKAMGITEEGFRQRALDKWGNADEILKQTDLDGDGMVDEEELRKAMEAVGISPGQAEALAREMMMKYDKDGDGKLTGDQYREIMGARKAELQERMWKKYESAEDAFDEWDTDGDGVISEEEFIEGCKELNISPYAAKRMFKKADEDNSNGLDRKEFVKAFGVGADELLERMFQKFGNPQKAFDMADLDGDHLLSQSEFEQMCNYMEFSPKQIARLWKSANTNHGENTHNGISRWELYTYIDWEEPAKVTWGDGFGDIDPFGRDHKKFNKLPHLGGDYVAFGDAAIDFSSTKPAKAGGSIIVGDASSQPESPPKHGNLRLGSHGFAAHPIMNHAWHQ